MTLNSAIFTSLQYLFLSFLRIYSLMDKTCTWVMAQVSVLRGKGLLLDPSTTVQTSTVAKRLLDDSF